MRKILQLTPRLLILPFFVATLLILGTTVKSQQSPETWGDLSIEPVVSSGQHHSLEEHSKASAEHRMYFGGHDCIERAFPIGTDGSIEMCWYENAAGYFNDGGSVFVPRDSSVAMIPEDYAFSVFPAWYKDIAIVVANDGSYIEFRQGASLDSNIDNSSGKPNFFTWKNTANLHLSTKIGDNGFPKIDLLTQAAYSVSGRWLLLFSSDGLLTSIDLENFSVRTLDAKKVSDSTYWAATAISDSGRYIATYEYGYDFIVIDTRECATNTNYELDMSRLVPCGSARSIKDYVWDNFDDLGSIFPQFHNDDVLRIHGLNNSVGAVEQIIQAPNSGFTIDYIALGDSYTSGEGANGYFGNTDEPNNRCHLSIASYPFVLQNIVNINSVRSVACSSAVINDIANVDIIDDNYEFQNSKPTPVMSLGEWTPGYTWQLDHIKRSSTRVSVVTVGIGGNDIGFGDMIKKCLFPGDCFSNTEERLEIAIEIQGQFHRLAKLFSEIRSSTLEKAPNARIFAISYPQIAKADGNCKPNVRLSNNEIKLSNDIITYLNSVIRSAATKAGIGYVSVENAFRGHRLCESTDTTAVNGLGFGNDTFITGIGPFGNESYHPTMFGHSLLARDIAANSNRLFRPLPNPSETHDPPSFLRTPLVMNAEDMPSGLRKRIYMEDLSTDVIIKGDVKIVNIISGDGELLSSSYFEATIRSEPTHIGSFLSDESGNLTFSYTVPLSIEPGFHTLHITGKNAAHEDIDIYKTVYVAHSYKDMNGNGVNDIDEPCGPFESSGIDEDMDGIDDACDPVISVPSHKHVNDSYTPRPLSHELTMGNASSGIFSSINHTYDNNLATNKYDRGAKDRSSESSSHPDFLWPIYAVGALMLASILGVWCKKKETKKPNY